MKKKDIKKDILILRKKLTGNMMKDLEIKDKIHKKEMELKDTKPKNSNIDCVGCGS